MNDMNMRGQAASLVANLKISVDGDLATVAVAGCDEISEISHLAMAIASNFAQGEKRILVVGCGRVDEQCPLFAGTPASHSARMLASGTASKEEAILPSGIDGVDVLSFDAVNKADSDLIADDAFIEMLEKLQTQYDCVVVAVPFANDTVDAAVVGHMADVTVLVAVEGKTRRRSLKAASDNLRHAGANVAGVCMVNPEA